MKILGLIGPAGCGKDTVANLLSEYDYHRVASADEMKRDVGRYLGMSVANVNYYKDKPLTILFHSYPDIPVSSLSIRTFLQQYGMDMRNEHGDNYWINRSVNSKIKEFGKDTKIVITDVLFQNEIDYIRSRGGHVAYINGRSMLTGEHKSHISEAIANDPNTKKKVDFLIDNSGTLSDLKNTINKTICEIVE